MYLHSKFIPVIDSYNTYNVNWRYKNKLGDRVYDVIDDIC